MSYCPTSYVRPHKSCTYVCVNVIDRRSCVIHRQTSYVKCPYKCKYRYRYMYMFMHMCICICVYCIYGKYVLFLSYSPLFFCKHIKEKYINDCAYWRKYSWRSWCFLKNISTNILYFTVSQISCNLFIQKMSKYYSQSMWKSIGISLEAKQSFCIVDV